MFFGTFSWHLPCQKTCDRSSHPAAERLFGAHFWHALGTKTAMTRTTHFLGQKTCNRSSHPSAGKFFGANLSNTLGTKSAITRRIQPQHSFSKGGGFAKRPQFAVPQRGAGVVLNGSVKSPVPEGFPFLTFPAASARPPTLSCEDELALFFRLFSFFLVLKKTLKK